jgi:hypothetical protein
MAVAGEEIRKNAIIFLKSQENKQDGISLA